jgi:alcohol dehydrogenase class IV
LDGVPPFSIGRLPRISFGPGRIVELPDAIARFGRRALLVTGSASFRGSSHWPALLDELDRRGIEHWAGSVASEPEPAVVDALVAEHRDRETDVVVGIGGGSVLDTAKAVAGLLRASRALVDHLEGLPEQIPYEGPALPWIAVPTTAGTGSEATRNGTFLVRGANRAKRSFRDERLVAAEAIVDPDLLVGQSPGGLAANGSDALTQLIEPYLSLRATRYTDALALDALRDVGEALPRWHSAVVGGRDDPAARSAMSYGALISGICLAQAGLGVVHGLVAPLSAVIDVPHGAGCGAMLVAGVEANVRALEGRVPDSQTLDKLSRLGRLLAGSTGNDAAARRALIDWLRGVVDRLSLPGLASYGLTDELIGQVAASARTSSSMRSNPIELTDEELADVLRTSL